MNVAKEDDLELTWVNVLIALSFILVDGISLQVSDNSHLFCLLWSRNREIHHGGLCAMSNSIIPHGIRMYTSFNGRVSFWIACFRPIIHS